jgi:anti-sigma factor RsiW
MTTDLHTLTGAYVLDAVDDVERAAFRRHLATCDDCAAEVAQLGAVVAMLGDLTEAPPPEALRSRVLAKAARTRQQAPVPAGERRWRRVAVAAVAAGVVAIAGTWAVMDAQLRHENGQVQTLQSERERIYAVMNAKDVQMRGADLPGGGRMAAAVSARQREGVAMLAGLPDPPAGEVYQMWLIAGAKSTSALVLPAGVLGGTLLFTWVPGADFGITMEPAGGSAAPSTRSIATIKLT